MNKEISTKKEIEIIDNYATKGEKISREGGGREPKIFRLFLSYCSVRPILRERVEKRRGENNIIGRVEKRCGEKGEQGFPRYPLHAWSTMGIGDALQKYLSYLLIFSPQVGFLFCNVLKSSL